MDHELPACRKPSGIKFDRVMDPAWTGSALMAADESSKLFTAAVIVH